MNLRPLLGVSKGYNPKGMGLFLLAYLRMYQIHGKPQDLDRVREFTRWLQENVSPGYQDACWGYNFDWANRSGFVPAATPTVVNTAFNGLSFLELARELRQENNTGVESLKVARSACQFILDELNRFETNHDEFCFSYTPTDQSLIHNANLLGAQLLAETYLETKENVLAETGLAAARFTASKQRSDGSWWYGEEPRNHWVDNFHTGFVLVSLKRIADCLATKEFEEIIHKGYAFWKNEMFTKDGIPKYYADCLYPVDIHCIAQAILTSLAYADLDNKSQEFALRLALWAIENMQDRQGYYYYQIHRWYINRIPYMRWSQAWMLRSLTELIYYTSQQITIQDTQVRVHENLG